MLWIFRLRVCNWCQPKRLSTTSQPPSTILFVCSALVSKASEALVLLQLLSTSNLGRLAARLDDASHKMLQKMVGLGFRRACVRACVRA